MIENAANVDPPVPLTEHRWLRPKPAHLCLGLFIVEGLLFLSERYRWFAFNERKGWTVLIALASVGIVLFMLLAWLAGALIFRGTFQFTLRSLLALVLVVAIASNWLAVEVKQSRQQHEAVEAILKDGGRVVYDYQLALRAKVPAEPPGPAWLRESIGEDFFEDVDIVSLSYSRVTDIGLMKLEGLRLIKSLNLRATGVTDSGLECLRGLAQLKELDIRDTRITNAGLESLKGLVEI
jgi:Leucine Rich repeat